MAASALTKVALSEWLVRRTWLKHLGTALLVIVITAITANTGIIPPYGPDQYVYDGVFAYVAPLGICWLLLQVRLAGLVKIGLPLFSLFLVGSVGTVLGVIAGQAVVGDAFGEKGFALCGMFVGTYIGGSVNFNAVALEYDVVKDPTLYAGSAVVDSAMTTIWMIVNVAVPRFLGRFWPTRGDRPSTVAEPGSYVEDDTETTDPKDLGMVLFLGAFLVWASESLSTVLSEAVGFSVPMMLILTTLSLIAAQIPFVHKLRGTRLLGMFAVLLFLAVIGALCDVQALIAIGDLGVDLSIFVTIIVFVHGTLVYGASALTKGDPVVASVASQANIGGGTSALALARSLGRPDLVVPAILVGSVGTALGTYLGFATAAWLQ